MWSRFIVNCEDIVKLNAKDIYFKGSSPSESQFQNHCIVFSMEEQFMDIIKRRIAILANYYHQDTIAILIGESKLIKAATPEEIMIDS
jgi:hypothetical protein